MIAQLRGVLAYWRPGREAAEVVVDVAGVGYRVLVPAGGGTRLPATGEPIELHTSLQVREDAMTLYGFASVEARDLFELLLGATGVGPKLALAALSAHGPGALRRALADGDTAALVLVPGVGRKLAQRLVLELRDKVGGAGQDDPVTGAAGEPTSARGEARLALLELGYTPAEAHRALERVDGASQDTGELLRAALRQLAEARSGS